MRLSLDIRKVSGALCTGDKVYLNDFYDTAMTARGRLV